MRLWKAAGNCKGFGFSVANALKKQGKKAREGTMTIRAVSYEEARLAHFKTTREKRKKTLNWWKYQKPYKQYDQQTLWEMCADLGNEISYLDDVIEMLEKAGVEG